jgi:hypothetical protein
MAVFSKTNGMIIFLHNLTLFLGKKTPFFGENIIKSKHRSLDTMEGGKT